MAFEKLRKFNKGVINEDWKKENNYLKEMNIAEICNEMTMMKKNEFRLFYVDKEKSEYLIPCGMTSPNFDGSAYPIHFYIFYSGEIIIFMHVRIRCKGKWRENNYEEKSIIEYCKVIKKSENCRDMDVIKIEINKAFECTMVSQAIKYNREYLKKTGVEWECEIDGCDI